MAFMNTGWLEEHPLFLQSGGHLLGAKMQQEGDSDESGGFGALQLGPRIRKQAVLLLKRKQH